MYCVMLVVTAVLTRHCDILWGLVPYCEQLVMYYPNDNHEINKVAVFRY